MNDFSDYLGNIKEAIEENYSSELLFDSVDHCLMQAVRCVIDSTFLTELLLTEIKLNTSRKFKFNLDIKMYDTWYYRFFILRTTDKKLKIYRQIKINRDLTCMLLDIYLQHMEKFCMQVENAYPVSLGIKIRNRSVSRHLLNFEKCRFWYRTYLEIREMICQKYYRHIRLQTAKIAYTPLKNRIDTNDMAMEYFINLMRAFNRFDIASGTFTSFVNNWFKYARSKSLMLDEVGNAFSIPSGIRTGIARQESSVQNFATEIHDNIPDEEVRRDVGLFMKDETSRVILEMIDKNHFYHLLKDYEFDDRKMPVIFLENFNRYTI